MSELELDLRRVAWSAHCEPGKCRLEWTYVARHCRTELYHWQDGVRVTPESRIDIADTQRLDGLRLQQRFKDDHAYWARGVAAEFDEDRERARLTAV